MPPVTKPGGIPEEGSERDPRPIVRLPRSGLPGAAIAIVAGLLALLLFVVLEARRRHPVAQAAANAGAAFPAAPPLVVPPEALAVPETIAAEPPRTILTTPLPRLPEIPRNSFAPAPQALPGLPTPRASEPTQLRASEPALVLVLDTVPGTAATSATSTAAATQSGGAQPGGATSAAGDDAPVRATVIRNRTTIMPAGTTIPATLETPIDSTRPGLVRAIVSEDARGFDGKRVLVPRGSRLIGEYQSDVRSSQNRVLVTWTRLIRPDGVAIRIGSPAADALGGAGIPGHLNTFFFRRFASAVLQSALTVGVNLASRPGNGSVIVGLPTNNVSNVGQELLAGNDLRPKITVKQGAMLNVFVARDLDFSGTPYRAQQEGP